MCARCGFRFPGHDRDAREVQNVSLPVRLFLACFHLYYARFQKSLGPGAVCGWLRHAGPLLLDHYGKKANLREGIKCFQSFCNETQAWVGVGA